jgi:hypothetical protein
MAALPAIWTLRIEKKIPAGYFWMIHKRRAGDLSPFSQWEGVSAVKRIKSPGSMSWRS